MSGNDSRRATIPADTPWLGAGALLAAATHRPISSVVLTTELTRRADPVMVPRMPCRHRARFVGGERSTNRTELDGVGWNRPR